MHTEPRCEVRAALDYVAVAATTSLQEMPGLIQACLDKLGAWTASRQLRAAGPPFVRYRKIDMPQRLEIEVCLPLAASAARDAGVTAGSLPAGRYVVMTHQGPYQELVNANASLLHWAEQHGLAFQVHKDGPATVWAARIETYLTDPQAEPDPQRHRTEIAYLAAW